MSLEIDAVMLGAALVGATIGASVTAAIIFVLHRRRIRRRNAHLYEIPPFLRGTADPGDDAGSRFKGNWTEIHPLPRRFTED